jgi:hypothetical protein
VGSNFRGFSRKSGYPQNKYDCTVYNGHDRMRPQKLNCENFEDWPSVKIGPHESFQLYGIVYLWLYQVYYNMYNVQLFVFSPLPRYAHNIENVGVAWGEANFQLWVHNYMHAHSTLGTSGAWHADQGFIQWGGRGKLPSQTL